MHPIKDDHAIDGKHDGPLLFGRVLDGRGGARHIGWDEAQNWHPHRPREMLWLHLDREHPGLREWLVEHLHVSGPTADLLVSNINRPRALHEGDALVATLRDINFNPGAEPEDMISMQLWSDGKRFLSLRRRPQQSPNEVRDQLDRDAGPRDAGAMITRIVELMIDHLSGAVVEINAEIDAIEASLDTAPLDEQAKRIGALRRDALALQRHVSPQHEALEQIGREAPDWFEAHDRREMAESIARLRRHLDDIEISKESAVVIQDELRARSQAAGQEATYKLGVIGGIFLPLTFFTGLLGINVAGIPYADEPWAFAAVSAICFTIVVVLLLIFHRRRWI